MKNLNDGVEQNDNLSLEEVRFALGTMPIAWEKIRRPAAKNRLTLKVPQVNPMIGFQRRNEGSERSKWSMVEGMSAALTAALRHLTLTASSLSGELKHGK